MKNINNIDELLRNSFDGFEATPPSNSWADIQQGVSKTPNINSQNTVSQTAKVFKSAGIISKITITAITSGIILGGGYLAFNYFNKATNTQTTVSVPQIQAPQNIEQKPIENLPDQNQNIKEEKSQTPSIIHLKQNSKNSSVSVENSKPIVEANENKSISINSPIAKITETKPVIVQTLKPEQKQVLPKPNHKISPPENNISSPAIINDESSFVKPKIGNSFTPDGDGINDKLLIIIENESFYDLKIYDSKNHLVFESDSKDKIWDGTKMNLGELCEEGDYTYLFNYQYKNTEKVNTKRGVVKIIR